MTTPDTVNPYDSPESALQTGDEPEFCEVGMFAKDRIGRMRYMAYSMGLLLMLYIPLFGFFFLSEVLEMEALAVVGFLFMLPFIYFIIMLMVRRLHDLNHTGWLGLIMFVPFVGNFFAIYVALAPGSQSANDYGSPPPENTTGVIIGALAIPAIAVIGIIAAVAVPAMQGNV